MILIIDTIYDNDDINDKDDIYYIDTKKSLQDKYIPNNKQKTNKKRLLLSSRTVHDDHCILNFSSRSSLHKKLLIIIF